MTFRRTVATPFGARLDANWDPVARGISVSARFRRSDGMSEVAG